VHLAAQLHGEIISGDSRQVYRDMTIGTGKDLNEYTVDNHAIPYHLIDIVDAGSQYNLYEYCQDFKNVYDDICARGQQPILCGGSGLYIEAAVNGYAMPQTPIDHNLRSSLEQLSTTELIQKLSFLQPQNTIADLHNRRRLIRAIEIATYHPSYCAGEHKPLPAIHFCITYSREVRRQRIYERLHERCRQGMVEEVQGLMQRGISAETLCRYGLEYKYITLYIIGQISYSQMQEQLCTAIYQFAKRQMTWFRGMERRGFTIHYIDGSMSIDNKVAMIQKTIAAYSDDAAK